VVIRSARGRKSRKGEKNVKIPDEDNGGVSESKLKESLINILKTVAFRGGILT